LYIPADQTSAYSLQKQQCPIYMSQGCPMFSYPFSKENWSLEATNMWNLHCYIF